MSLPVGWMDYSSSIGIFSVTLFCRNSSQVDVEDWESLSWIRCTLIRKRICSVRGVKKDTCPDSISLICVYVFTDIDREEGIHYVIAL